MNLPSQFLQYRFNAHTFKFMSDGTIIVEDEYGDIYRITLNNTRSFPFTIELLERR